MTNELNIQSDATPPITDWLAGVPEQPSTSSFSDVAPNPISATSELTEVPATPEVRNYNDHIDAMADISIPTPDKADSAIGPAVFYPGKKIEPEIKATPETSEVTAEPTIEPVVEATPTEAAIEEAAAETTISEPELGTEPSFPEETVEVDQSEDKVQETLAEVDNWLSKADQLRGSIRESLANLAEQKTAETERHQQALASENEQYEQKMAEFKELEDKFKDAEKRVEERYEKKAA